MIDLILNCYLKLEDYLSAGGLVMLPLALVSLVMWVLIADRALFFRRLHRKNMDTRTAFEHIRADRMPDHQHFRGAVSLLVAKFLSRRSGDRNLDRFILDETVLKVSRSLNDYLALIGVLAAIAPFWVCWAPSLA
jgi:biopolymer transport protein ExbB